MESKILLDNATLTSIQRALGYLGVQNNAVVDLDISNLSNFCEAVLFNDEIYVPYGLYKSKYIHERRDLFSEMNFKELHIDDQTEADISRTASASFARWCFNYKDDQNGLFNKIMSFMDIYMRFVWNYRSSEYWLVLRAFQKNERNTSTQRIPIFESLLLDKDGDIWNSLDKLNSHDIVDLKGRILDDDNLQDGYHTMNGPKKVMAALAWNIFRAIYYRIIATLHDCVYYPHSLRGIGAVLDSITVADKHINEDTLSRYGFPKSSQPLTNLFEDILKSQKTELFEVGAIHGGETFAIPPLLGYILSKTKNREEFFEVLLRMKEDKRLVDLRSELREFEESVRIGDISGIRKWKRTLDKTNSAVKKEMGIDDSKFELNPLTYISGGMINENGLGIRIPKSLNRIIAVPSDWRLWFREVALNLRNVARLGKEYEKLKSWAIYETTEGHNWYSKNDYPNKFTHTLDKGIKS